MPLFITTLLFVFVFINLFKKLSNMTFFSALLKSLSLSLFGSGSYSQIFYFLFLFYSYIQTFTFLTENPICMRANFSKNYPPNTHTHTHTNTSSKKFISKNHICFSVRPLFKILQKFSQPVSPHTHPPPTQKVYQKKNSHSLSDTKFMTPYFFYFTQRFVVFLLDLDQFLFRNSSVLNI
jgi:hypothetical protein